MNNVDSELLILAATAAGLTFDGYTQPLGDTGYLYTKEHGRWNPLHDDGDEARLESTLCLHVEWQPMQRTVWVGTANIGFTVAWGNDKQAARRQAGVLCAAQIGKNLNN